MIANKRVAVIGGGSWATAIIKILLENVNHVNWYIRNQEDIDYIVKHHHNAKYLSSIEIDVSRITFYNSMLTLLMDSEILIFAIPAPFIREAIEGSKVRFDNKIIVSAIKGIIPEANLTIAEFFNQKKNINFDDIVIVSGPSHAEEIALERLSYLTISAKYKKTSTLVGSIFSTHYVKTIISRDIYGAEYAAILKNIYAIAAGICHGLGYGDNFQAVLVSNAHQEMKRFLDKTYKNKNKRRINSSAYLGDLIVTCYSQFSRNRTFGAMIGKGYSVKSAQLEMNMIAEGYYAAKSIKQINEKHGVKMPIADAVYNILYERISPVIEIKILTEKLQ